MFSKIKKILGSDSLPPESPWAGANATPVVSDTVQRADRTFHRPTAQVYRVRRGMWVVVPLHGVGILTNVYEGGGATVMLTDEVGENKIAISVPLMGVRQAKLMEIPAPRRPDATVAINLGYS
jgi:hypothetical protein